MAISGEDISGLLSEEVIIERFLGSLFSPQYNRLQMNQNNTQETPIVSNMYRIGSRVRIPLNVRNNNTQLQSPLSMLFSMIGGRSDGNMRDILQTSINDTGGTIKKASPNFIKTLSSPEEIPDDTVCGVCQDDISSYDIDKLLKLPCGHIYDKECILEWFKKSCSCPICRKEFDSIEVSLHPTNEREVIVSDEDNEGDVSDGEDEMRDYVGVSDEDISNGQGREEDVDDTNGNNMINIFENMLSEFSGVGNSSVRIIRTPFMGNSNILRHSVMDEETILQEAILRSIRDV